MAEALDMRNADAVIALLERAAETLHAHPLRRGCTVHLPARGRLLASGDLHDHPVHLEKIIAAAALAKDQHHHVVLQELIHGERLINGMDFSYRVLCKVAMVITAHPTQVHPLLGNHEIAQLTNHGVSKGAGNSVELFSHALDFIFGDDAESVANALRTFARAMPLALVSEHGVGCMHSLPNERLMHRFDMGVFDRELEGADYQGQFGAAYLLTWGRVHTDAQVAALAERLGIKWFCLGHQHVEMGAELRGPQVLVLNSDHERGAVLTLDLANVPSAEEALRRAVPLQAIGTSPMRAAKFE